MYVLYVKPTGRLYYAAVILAFLILSTVVVASSLYLKVIPFFDAAKVVLGLLVIAVIITAGLIAYFQTAYIKVEDKTVIVKRGVLNVKTMRIPFEKVDSLKTESNVFEILLGIETLMIDTSGTDEIEVIMPNLPKSKVEEFMAYYQRWRKEIATPKEADGAA